MPNKRYVHLKKQFSVKCCIVKAILGIKCQSFNRAKMYILRINYSSWILISSIILRGITSSSAIPLQNVQLHVESYNASQTTTADNQRHEFLISPNRDILFSDLYSYSHKMVYQKDGENFSHNWVGLLLLFITLLLQSRPNMIWSDSRMLRKINYRLQAQTPLRLFTDIRQGLDEEIDGESIAESKDIVFARLYEKLSKGRNRFVGRSFTHFAFISLWCIELAESFEQPYIEILESEVLISFRLLLTVGSFGTLGAFKPTLAEAISLSLSISGAVFLTAIMRTTVPYNSIKDRFDRVLNVFSYVRIACIAIGLLLVFRQMLNSFFNEESHISNIVNCIMNRTISSKPHHIKRLEDMRNMVRRGDSSSYGRLSAWSVRGNIGPLNWFGVFLFMVSVIEGAVYSVVLPQKYVPRFFVLETSSYILFFLLILNDTHVENELLFQLLRISEQPL